MLLQSLVVSFLLAVQIGDRPASGPEITSQEIDAASKKLGSDIFAEREAATRLLWSAWPASQETLELAANGDDREVAARAKSILENTRLGIFADTPKAVAELIGGFHAADQEARRTILRQVYEMGQSQAILALIRTEPDVHLRRNLAKELLERTQREIAKAVQSADYSRAENLLALAARIDDEPRTLRDYGTLLLLRGRLDRTIAQLKSAGAQRLHPDESRVLARLLQIQGNVEEAYKLAKSTDDEWLLYDLQYRTGDWAPLAANKYYQSDLRLEDLGFRAAFHRLSGNQLEFERATMSLRKLAAANPDEAWMCSENLMINGRWEDARELFAAVSRGRLFELHRGKMQFSEAFSALGITKPRTETAREFIEKKLGKVHLGIVVATTLNDLGERDESRQLLESLVDVAPEYPGFDDVSLLQVQLKLGHRELAMRTAVTYLAKKQNVLGVLYQLLPDHAYEANEWWEQLRVTDSKEVPAETLDKVLTLFKGTPVNSTKLEVAELVAEARIAASELEDERRYFRLSAIGHVCSIWGQNELARAVWTEQVALAAELKPNGSTYDPPRTLGPLLKIGDLWSREGQWNRAAETYRRGWESHPEHAVSLYLSGYALVKAGQEEQGRRLMEQAIILPLADTDGREKLIRQMQKLGLNDEALGQCEIVLRVGPFEGWEGSECWAVAQAAQVVAEHIEKSDPLRAANLWQRELFYLLKTNSSFDDAGDYAEAVHRIHKTRAIGLLDAGRFDEALREIGRAQSAKLGDAELVERAIPKMIAAGKQTEAERLFTDNYSAYLTATREFPRSAYHHNGLAWLAARCNRELDAALSHAHEATRLVSDNAAYFDTLAEVYFRRGDPNQAVMWETKAVQREPKNVHFQSQLRRFQQSK